MYTPEEIYFNATPEDVTNFLIELYSGTIEGNMIKQLKNEGKTVLELPIDFEPYHLNKHIELGDIIGRFEGFDYMILYHGTSSVHRKEIEKNGLLPRTETGISNFDDEKESLPDSVYFGQLNYFGNILDCVKVHAYQNMLKKGGKPLICRCIIPLKTILEDEDVGRAQSGIASVSMGGTARVLGGIKTGFVIYEFPKVKAEFDIKMHTFDYYEFQQRMQQ